MLNVGDRIEDKECHCRGIIETIHTYEYGIRVEFSPCGVQPGNTTHVDASRARKYWGKDKYDKLVARMV